MLNMGVMSLQLESECRLGSIIKKFSTSDESDWRVQEWNSYKEEANWKDFFAMAWWQNSFDIVKTFHWQCWAVGCFFVLESISWIFRTLDENAYKKNWKTQNHLEQKFAEFSSCYGFSPHLSRRHLYTSKFTTFWCECLSHNKETSQQGFSDFFATLLWDESY